jgi:hypothetical protein
VVGWWSLVARAECNGGLMISATMVFAVDIAWLLSLFECFIVVAVVAGMVRVSLANFL